MAPDSSGSRRVCTLRAVGGIVYFVTPHGNLAHRTKARPSLRRVAREGVGQRLAATKATKALTGIQTANVQNW